MLFFCFAQMLLCVISTGPFLSLFLKCHFLPLSPPPYNPPNSIFLSFLWCVSDDGCLLLDCAAEHWPTVKHTWVCPAIWWMTLRLAVRSIGGVCVGARTRRNMLGVRDEQVRSAELEIPLNPRHHADIRTSAHTHVHAALTHCVLC